MGSSLLSGAILSTLPWSENRRAGQDLWCEFLRHRISDFPRQKDLDSSTGPSGVCYLDDLLVLKRAEARLYGVLGAVQYLGKLRHRDEDVMLPDETGVSKEMVIEPRFAHVELQARDNVIFDLCDDLSDIHAVHV
jgi:hypothetical protein